MKASEPAGAAGSHWLTWTTPGHRTHTTTPAQYPE
jgi:hypothetical protein